MAESLYAYGVGGNPAYRVPSKTNTNPVEDRIITEYQRYLNQVRQLHGTRVGMGGQSLPTYQQFKTKYLRDERAATPKPIADPGEAIGMALGYRNYQNVMERAAKRYNLPEVGMFAQRPEDYAAEYAARGAPKAPKTATITGSTTTRLGQYGRGTMSPEDWAKQDIISNRQQKTIDARREAEAEKNRRKDEALEIARTREARMGASAKIRDELNKARLSRDADRIRELTALGQKINQMDAAAIAKLNIANIGRGLPADVEANRAAGEAVQEQAEMTAREGASAARAEQARNWSREMQEDRQLHAQEQAAAKTMDEKLANAVNRRDTAQQRILEMDEAIARGTDEKDSPALIQFYKDTKAKFEAEVKKYDEEVGLLERQADVRAAPTQAGGGQIDPEAIRWLLNNPNDPRAPAIRKKLGL